MTKSIDIKAALVELNINPKNSGTSTGTKWMSSGKDIESCSPVDGTKIGAVTTTTTDEFDKVMIASTSDSGSS